jgi:hypothetical protein
VQTPTPEDENLELFNLLSQRIALPLMIEFAR